jgi:hypothetical protein
MNLFGAEPKPCGTNLTEWSGEGWKASVRKVSPDTPNAEERWAGSFEVKGKHLFESLAASPDRAAQALHEQVADLTLVLVSLKGLGHLFDAPRVTAMLGTSEGRRIVREAKQRVREYCTALDKMAGVPGQPRYAIQPEIPDEEASQ